MELIVQEKIKKIDFKVLGPQTIGKMGVVKIVTPELYDSDGYPVEGGLMDLKLGVIDPVLKCKTCGGKVKECPGHFGTIELGRPVLHIKYIKNIYDFLKCTCSKCGRILLPPEEFQKAKEKIKKIEKDRGIADKWKFVKLIIKKTKTLTKCPYCGDKKGKIKFDKPSTFYEDGVRLTPVDIRERLERIPDEDCELLDLDPASGRPEWMVITLLPVPPVTVRPSITLENGSRSEDDLTHKLGDIVRTNQRLFENLNAGAPEIIIEDLWDLLQYHVTTFFDNEISQIPPARHRSGRPLRTLAERIKGKEGRFRRNLAGKRVNYSARTVISPDPRLRIHEVGIPKLIAMELTIPERVTEWNLNYLKKFLLNGPSKYPGANYVITPDNKRKKITAETQEALVEELRPGYVIERHLVNGDTVLFNRQPSLHRMSIMAHKVRVLPYKTFRLNLCVCVPYNADFDGDEMNLHIPQTEEARAEARMLMEVRNQLMTPRSGIPLIGCVQDHVSGCYLLTKDEQLFSLKEASELLNYVNVDEELPKSKVSKGKAKYWTGKQIFSMILPKDIDYEGITKTCKKHAECLKEKCESSNYVKIEKGNLICGYIDSKSIGSGGGALIHKIIHEYGNEKAAEFMYKASLLGIKSLQMNGFTVLPTDTDLPENANKEIKRILGVADKKIQVLLQKFAEGKLEAYPGRTVDETLEFRILSVLNRARNKSGKIVEETISSDNFTAVMADSGARGSILNLVMISALLGQQALRGMRITKGYFKRTLPHFSVDDLGARSHGFIKHGYKEGLTPYEFFFHSITGRDSIMDTSMRTPRSGYLQRRLINALQDLKVVDDKSVRDTEYAIVQFKYGEDGVDVSKTDAGKIKIKVQEK